MHLHAGSPLIQDTTALEHTLGGYGGLREVEGTEKQRVEKRANTNLSRFLEREGAILGARRWGWTSVFTLLPN